MKRIFLTFFGIAVLGILFWFTYTKYQLRKFEIFMAEELLKEKAYIGFWSQSEKPVMIKITSGSGSFRWVALQPGAGFSGPFDAGKTKIERIRNENVISTFIVTLGKDTRVDFDVYENKFEPK